MGGSLTAPKDRLLTTYMTTDGVFYTKVRITGPPTLIWGPKYALLQGFSRAHTNGSQILIYINLPSLHLHFPYAILISLRHVPSFLEGSILLHVFCTNIFIRHITEWAVSHFIHHEVIEFTTKYIRCGLKILQYLICTDGSVHIKITRL